MYICPICNKEFQSDQNVSKHYLNCWKDNSGYRKPKPAPRSEDVNTSNINDEVLNFFSLFN